MAADRPVDFKLGALYLALDAQRQVRGLTWREAMEQINLRSSGVLPVHPIALSTVSNLRTKAIAEGDGVLQMLRWLNRTPESFVSGCEFSERHRLPEIPWDRVLRFDTAALHAALDAQRRARRLTWQQVASEIGATSAVSLTHLRKGGRTAFPHVMRIVRWLGQPAAVFTRPG